VGLLNLKKKSLGGLHKKILILKSIRATTEAGARKKVAEPVNPCTTKECHRTRIISEHVAQGVFKIICKVK
jgi:hypothetical protein